jgi:hypothetical protein
MTKLEDLTVHLFIFQVLESEGYLLFYHKQILEYS